ncbi:LacI family DNA-binding transcriptional regulator [Pararhizobium sp. IMCC21322]|uniref:LacI family DNA-binding transcriptional regulator n=1 Tax=Pararhizobium sp. IMCC21322 TaxID=3067903 RepID=UPI002742365E|nr:LacI family DNA-binding transcriptional regulator [Pararhizobium sp. IMCC21322]
MDTNQPHNKADKPEAESAGSDHRLPKRPTLKTIAMITGLSIATVSRALKDASDIGEATKSRVREVANEIGYRPNRAGVRLRTGKTNVICLVMSAESHVMNHTAQLIYSISTALRNTSYHLNVTPYSADDDPMEPIRYIVETGSADGVILNQIEPKDPRIAYLSKHGLPFATHGRTEMGIAHPYFDFDNERFTELGVEKLVSLGRRNLALLSPPAEQTYGKHMISGFGAAAERLGVNHRTLELVTSDSDMTEIEAALSKTMKGPNPPDGFISGSTSGAMAIVNAVENEGLLLGTDVDLVAKEALHFLVHFRKEIIVVRENVSQAGTFLVKALTASIEKDGPPQQDLEIPLLEL